MFVGLAWGPAVWWAPDEAIEALNEEVEEVAEEIAEAQADVEAGDVTGAEARLQAAEDRLASLETSFADLRQAVEGRAPVEHEHPVPAGMRSLMESVQELEAEEQAPERQHPLHRKLKLFGRGE